VFFVLYDGYMIWESCRAKESSTASAFSTVLAICCCLTKVRWVLPSLLETSLPFGIDPVAVLEWSDVFGICAWSLLQLWPSEVQVFKIAIVDSATCELNIRSSVSMLQCAAWASVVGMCTAIAPLLMGAGTGGALQVNSMHPSTLGHDVPSIASGWESQPGNWIGHWGCVNAAVALVMTHLCIASTEHREKGEALATLSEATFSPASVSSATLGTAVVAAGALAMYGVVTAHEFPEINRWAGAVYYVSITCSMLGSSYSQSSTQHLRSLQLLFLGCGVCLVCIRFYLGALTPSLALSWLYRPAVTGAYGAFEWAHYSVAWLFLMTSVLRNDKRSSLKVAIVQTGHVVDAASRSAPLLSVTKF